MKEKIYVGIDLAKASSRIAVLDSSGESVLKPFSIANSNEEEERYINILLSNRTPGIILLTPTQKDANIINLAGMNYPYVLINSKVASIKSDMVSIDHFQSAKTAVNYLIAKGHKRIAHFAGFKDAYGIVKRIEGYKAALNDNGIEIDEDIIIKDGLSFDGGYRSAEKLINMSKRPTAIFTANDIVAIAAFLLQYHDLW